jgi:hypothetical protein
LVDRRVLAVALLAGCSSEPTVDLSGRDGGAVDSGVVVVDAGVRDAGAVDAGSSRDAGRRDAGGPRDGGEPTLCTSDAECAPTGWCRATMDGDRECARWAGEGERCGGDTTPWAQERCDPALVCFDSEISSAPGSCVIEATLRALLNNHRRYDGHAVGIAQMDVFIGPVQCTTGQCPPENRCCNTCRGELQAEELSGTGVDVRMTLRDPNGDPYLCEGDVCTWQQHCDLEPGTYRAWGWFSAPPPSLSVQRIEPRP